MKLSTIAVAVGSVATAVLIGAGPYALKQWAMSRAQAARNGSAERAAQMKPRPASLPTAPPFTRVQVVGFLEKAETAAAIKDPLQRCLAYPDPPGSDWNPAAVRAYCHYRYQPVPGMDEIKQLIQSGQAAKLDQLLAVALHAQQTDPDARGRLDRIYQDNFDSGAFELRQLVDAWKRQDPDSAFAYAASGVAYAEASSKARGNDYLYKTPRSNLESMDRLAALADADLQHALVLNPHLAPVYRQMIMLGGLTLGGDYAMRAVKRSLVETPDDLGVYDQWMWLEQPNWYGSYDAMDAVALHAAGRVVANPLLALEVVQKRLYQIRKCDCTEAQTDAQYRAVARQLLGYGDFASAGDAAQLNNDLGAAGIYFAEALRFNDKDQDARNGFAIALGSFDFKRWSLAEGERAVADAPHDDGALAARGFAYTQSGQWDAALADFKAAVAIDPSYGWAWDELGRTYAMKCEWDEAWQVANREVEKDPTHTDGWDLRAAVQVYQPRPGLKDTMASLKQWFPSDPVVNAELTQLAKIERQREQQRAQAAHAHQTFHLAAWPPPWFAQCRQYANFKFIRQPAPAHGHG